MKKVTRKVKQALSILLVAAMVITMVPQNTLAVSAEEAVETVTESETVETTVTAETEETDTENVDETENSDEDADTEESEEGEADEETDETDTEETVDEETEEDENLEDEEIVEEKTEEGIKKGADGFEAMAAVNVSTKVLTDGAATIDASGSAEPHSTYIFSVTLADGYENLYVNVYTDFDNEKNTGTECPFREGATNGSTTAYSINAPGKDFTIVASATKITYDLTFEITGADVKKTDPENTVINAGAVKVDYGESLSFTAVAQEGYKEDVTVTTQSGSEEPVTLTANDGVYTIAPTGDLKVTVSAEELGSSRLTFAFDGDATGLTKATVSEVKIGGVDATITTFNSESVTPYLGNIHEDKEVTFKVAQEGVYKFKVESNTGAEGAQEEMTAKDGVYSIKLTKDTTITVTSELDPDQCSVLDITANEKSLADKFTVKVGDDEEPYNATASKNQFLTADTDTKSVVVTPTDKENYTIKSIELDGTALKTETGDGQTATINEETGAWTFNVNWSAKRDQAIKVYVAPKGSDAASTVTFKNQTAHMKLEVTEVKDKVTGIGSDKYTVAAGVDFFRFTITADGKYEPTVTDSSLSEVKPVATEKKDDKTVYTYDVEARTLDEEEEITITEENAKYNVAVVYDTAAIESVEFIQNGESVSVTPVSDDEKSTATLEAVEDGDKVIVTVNAKDGYKLVSASEKVGSAEPKATDLGENTDAYTYELTVSDDTTTTIKTKAITQVVLNDGEADLATNSKGEYDVAFGDGKAYTAQLTVGGEAQNLTEVTVDDPENIKTKAVASGNTANITLAKEDAGKQVKITLKSGEGNSALTGIIVLNVAKPAADAKITVAGVKNKKLKQFAGTNKKYDITIPAGYANTLALDVPSEAAAAGISASINAEGKLEVTVADTATPEKQVTIKLYDANDTTNKKALNGGEITVVPAYLLNGVTPTVALKRATDVDLVLTLGTKGTKINDEEVKSLNGGKLYYKVVVTPEDTARTELQKRVAYVERDAATNDTEAIKVNKGDLGKGKAANFKVDVTLVQTKSGALVDETDTNVAFATTAVTANVATKDPYFTTKLGSKKLNGGKAYTKQTDVEVAQITFDKDTTWTNLQVDSVDNVLHAKVVGDKLVLGYNSNPITVNPGKYDVTVKAVDDGNKLHVATTTVKVEIVRGIEDLYITAPKTLYKKDNKTKASFKADVSYNSGNPDQVPKTKKVTWTVTNTDGTDLSPANAKLITVKNGTVTVDKNYVVSANKAENKFRLNVKAADYKGNPVYTWADFEITSQAAELGDVIIVNGNGSEGWTLVDVTKPVKADELAGAYAVVLKKGVAIRDYYTEEGLAAVKADAEVTFKSSNNKAVSIESDTGWIWVNKPAKNVKITVTATDGSKAFKTITLKEVGYTAADDIGLMINSKYGSWYNLEDKDLSFYGPKDAPFVLMPVLKHSDEGWIPTAYASISDCTVSVKNAKIVAKDVELGAYGIIATGSPITITLQSKSLNKKVEYKLTNKSIANATANAPKLKTTDKLIGGSYYVPEEPRTQTVTYTLPKEYAGKFIQITSDYNDYYKNDKNELRYNAFEYACDEIGTIVRVNSAGQVTLTFKAVDYNYTNIPAGSYKLNYLVGSYDIDGNFVAETKPGSVTLKAVAQKAVKAKLNTSYTMSVKEGAKVGLALNNKNAILHVNNLQNANIKGQENEFTTYFELNGNYLKLKDTLSPEKLEKIISNAAKNDLTGWVTYSYTDDRGDYQGEGEAQIKVSFKDLVQKYSLSKATVLDDAKEVTVNAFTGKDAPANVSCALVTKGDFAVKAVAGNAITLTAMKTPLAKSNKVKMLIVPANSYYIDEFDGKTGDDLKKLIEKYGVEVSTTITAKEKASTTGKIKVDSKKASQTFKATELNKDYEIVEKKGSYIVKVPYTTTVDNAPATFTATIEDEINAKLFKVTAADNEITVKLSKAELAAAVAAGKVKYSEGTKLAKRDVKIKLTADGYADETVTLKLTLPEKAKTYAEVKDDVKAAVKELTTGKYDAKSETKTQQANAELVADAVKAVVPVDSDTDYSAAYVDTTYTAPTKAEAGSIQIKVALTDKTAEAPTPVDVAKVTLTIGKLDTTVADFVVKVSEFISYYDSNKLASNSTTAESLLAAAREYVKADQYPEFRVMLTMFVKTEATKDESGSISYSFKVKDITTGDVQSLGSGVFTIDRFKDLATTDTYIENYWSSVPAADTFIATLKNMDQDTAKKAVIDWVTALINNPDISVKESNLTVTVSSSQGTGRVSGTVTLEDKSITEANTTEVDLTSKDIPVRDTAAETKDLVDAALAAYTATNETDATDIKNLVENAIKNKDITATCGENWDGVSITKATEIAMGSITATVTLTDSKKLEDPGKTATVNVSLTIAKLPQNKIADSANAAKLALDKLAVTNDTTQASVLQAVVDAVNPADEYADVTIAWKQVADPEDSKKQVDDYKLTPATSGVAGSIKGTIVITIDKESTEVKVEKEITAL